MQNNKKKLHYKIVSALYADYHTKNPSDEEKMVRVQDLEAYIDTVVDSGAEYKDDVKSLSMIVGLTQKKVVEVCKSKNYKVYKEPDLAMFGVSVTPDDVVEELLESSPEELRIWVGNLLKANKSTQYSALEDGKIEFVDTTKSLDDLELSYLALNNPQSEDLKAHAIWYLQEVTRMIKSGELTSICVVGKSKTGEAVSYIPKFVSENNRLKIINSVFDALEGKKSAITIN